MSSGTTFNPKSLASLRRIADVLGTPLKSFFQDTSPSEQIQLIELLRLWKSITTLQARNRLLCLARREAALCGEEKHD